MRLPAATVELGEVNGPVLWDALPILDATMRTPGYVFIVTALLIIAVSRRTRITN
jgi:hypothetical protein